ncbi:unnamed protein product [Paramecium octaurelia]|uniref:TLDc domain-containing protein n=1 Tax=Paramecium octaurelia TaxID=43137 RepID=A0A8S1YDQ8_PAROT|nr:unnamed protein product [Paramecium octaurelia]
MLNLAVSNVKMRRKIVHISYICQILLKIRISSYLIFRLMGKSSDNLNKFSEEELEGFYLPFENALIKLKDLLENLIQNGRENLEKFKEKCKESKQQLHQELKTEEIAQLIKELELKSNEDKSVQNEILQKLIDIKQQINQDLIKEQSSKIKKIFNEASLTIFKFNLNCNKQINDISTYISQNTENLKEYFIKSFSAIYRETTQFVLFINPSKQKRNNYQNYNQNQAPITKPQIQPYPNYRSKILPQYYFDYILKQVDVYIYSQLQPFQTNPNYDPVSQYYVFTPTNLEMAKGICFWKLNTNNQFRAKLLIFKSDNDGNPIFGYFKYNVVEFIFSFTHNEIYPKKKSIQTNQQQSKQDQDLDQSFIVGNKDIQIYPNMIDGQSNLGEGFLWDSYNDNMNKSEYLFGGAKPNIMLCEIFYF